MRKADRHLLIKQLIQASPIRTQEDLLNKLEEHGVHATQATISRDIRDLKIVKAPDENGITRFELFKGANEQEQKEEESKRLIQMIEEIVLHVERVHFLTIVTTLPDNAQLFAAVLDEIHPAHIISTLAGFDTVVVISGSDEDAQSIETYFNNYILH
ncbi:MAG: arginine repressor [Enterococcus sp.]